MNKIVYSFVFITSFIALTLCSQNARSQAISLIGPGSPFELPKVNDNQHLSKGDVAENLWYSNEAEWEKAMAASLKIDVASFEAFLEKNETVFHKDRADFFSAAMADYITASNVQKFFDNLNNKYIELYQNGSTSMSNSKNPNDPLLPDACNPACTNMSFQNSTLQGWSAWWGVNGSSTAAPIVNSLTGGACGAVTLAAGPDPNTGSDYHVTLMTTPGNDVIAGPLIPYTPPMGGLSAMIGDGPTNGYGVGRLEQAFIVDNSNPIITIQYAAVLENPGHTGWQQPWLKIEVLDQAGNVINACAQFNAYVTSGIPGFKGIWYPANGDSVYCKGWTVVYIPMYNYVGQCVTIRFTASDCALGGHFGYAYVSAICSKINLIASSKVFCNGQNSATITAPPGAAAFQWITSDGCFTGPTNGRTVTVCSGGTYSVVVTSTAGATCKDTISITIPAVSSGPPPIPCFTANEVCSGRPASPTLFDATCSSPNSITDPGAKFYWDFYNSGSSFNDSTSGMKPSFVYSSGGYYFVRLHEEASNGCGADTVIKIAVDSSNTYTLPQSTVTPTPTSSCTACDGKITYKVTAGSTAVKITSDIDAGYVQLGGGSLISSGGNKGCGTSISNNTATLSYCNLCAGVYHFYVKPQGTIVSTKCSAGSSGDTIEVIVNSTGANITSTATVNHATCGQNNGTATLTGLGGTAPYTFTWPGAMGTGPTKTGLAPGSYKVIIKDANGCIGQTTIVILQFPNLPASITPFDVSCFGANDGKIKVSTLGGTAPFTYAWTPNVTALDSTGGLAPGNYSIVVTDNGGCSATVTATISQPTKVVESQSCTCTNLPCNATGSVNLTVSGGYPPYSFNWSNGATTQNVTGLKPGSYTVTIKDAFGCSVSDNVLVTTVPPAALTISPPTTICTGKTSTVSASGGVTYLWTPGNMTTASVSVSPTATTIYSVLITDAGGCNGVLSTTVNVNPLPTVGITPPSSICINQNITLTASGGNTYVWTPAGNGSSITVNPVTNTPYTVTVTDVNGCINTANTSVTVNPLPIVTITSNSPVCIGNSITLTASAPNTTNYSWTSGPNASTYTVTLGAGTFNYTVTATDNNGCVNTATAPVTVNPLPIVNITPPSAICINGSMTLTASGGNTYVWTPAGSGSTITVSPITLGPNSYSVTVTDGNTCVNSASTTVTVNPLPVVNLSPPSAICIGQSTTLTASGGTNYVWSPGGRSSITVNPTSNTPYTVTVTDGNNCVNSASTSVTVNPLPTPSITSNSPVCVGGSITLTATGGTSFVWTGGPSTPTYTVTPGVGSTSYTVTATDNNGCTNTASASVTVNPLPVVSVNTDVICKNASTTLTATVTGNGPYTYLWNTTEVTSAITVTPLTIGANNYTVTVVDKNGCSQTANTTVTVNPFLTVTMATDPAICIGTSAVIAVANPNNAPSYVWTGLAGNTPTQTVSPTSNTSYTVLITDANGCTGTGTINVTVNPLPTITITNNSPVCVGNNITLTAAGGSTYVWTGGPSTPTYTVTQGVGTSSYTVIGTDVNGCTNTANSSATVNPLPVPVISAPLTICTGTPTTLTAGGGTNYLWSDGTIGSTITVSPTITSTYSVIVTDNNNCSASTNTTINVQQNLNVTVNTATTCIGGSVTLNAVCPGATMYSWSSGETTASITFTPASSGSFTYTIDAKNQYCQGTATTNITVNPLPVINISPPVAICIGNSINYTASGGNSYVWTSSAGSTFNGASITDKPTASGTYNLLVTDGNGCSNTSSTSVTVNPLPVVTISPNTGYCQGSSAQLTAGGGGPNGTYVWTPCFGLFGCTSSNPIAQPTSTTSYVVNVVDGNGCTGSNTVLVTVYPVPLAVASNVAICTGETTKLNGNGSTPGMIYSWTPSNDISDPTALNPVFNGNTTTVYTLTVSAPASVCPPSTATMTVTVNPLPTINAFIDSTNIIAGQQIHLTANTSGISYEWFPSSGLSCSNCANPIGKPLHSTKYVVSTVDANGCRNRDTVWVNVEDIITLYVPNAFTPYTYGNISGKNPVFYAYGVGVKDFDFYIFNRWGELIFETHDLNTGWDGTFKGQQVQDDVYVWLAKGKSYTGKIISRTGPVTIVR